MNISKQRVGVIGAGNMAQCIIGGMLASDWHADQVIATARSEETRSAVQRQFGIQVSDNNLDAATIDILLLCVKPNLIKSVLAEIAPALEERSPLIISVAAGVTMASLDNWSGGNLAIIRSMPNTPSLVGAGACGLFANSQVTHEQKGLAESIFQSVGIAEWVDDEELINAVIAVSGSAPAYYFLFMEAMKKTGVQLGLPPAAAERLTQQTALGAARMAIESPVDIAQLRQNVCSPGGTTEQAIKTLQEGGLEQLIHNAMNNAVKRAKEMAEALGSE